MLSTEIHITWVVSVVAISCPIFATLWHVCCKVTPYIPLLNVQTDSLPKFFFPAKCTSSPHFAVHPTTFWASRNSALYLKTLPTSCLKHWSLDYIKGEAPKAASLSMHVFCDQFIITWLYDSLRGGASVSDRTTETDAQGWTKHRHFAHLSSFIPRIWCNFFSCSPQFQEHFSPSLWSHCHWYHRGKKKGIENFKAFVSKSCVTIVPMKPEKNYAFLLCG